MGEARERHSTRIRKTYKGKHVGMTQEGRRTRKHREGVGRTEEKHKNTDMKAQEKHSKHIGIMRKVSDEQRKSIAKV